MILTALAAVAIPTLLMAADEARLMRFPATNGSEIVFSYAGDLYKVPATGGEAQRLTSYVGYEMFPRFSPDGKTIAFTSFKKHSAAGAGHRFCGPAGGGPLPRSRPCCRRVLYGIRGPHFGYAAGIASAAKLAGLVFVLFIVIAFPLPAAAAELPAGVQQILQQSELTPDKLVHITLQELLQTLAGWLKNAWGQPLQLARRAVLFLLLSSCVGLLADGGAWRDCVDLVAVLGFGTIALNQMTSLVQQVAQAANTSQLYVSGFVPVFAGVALLAGQTAGAAVYSTMFYAMAAFLAEVLQNLLLPLLQIYFCFSVSAALWGDSGIADAANLFARCFTFALKLCGMLFTFVLGLQNVLAAGTDRAALKIGKSVLSAAVPVVGDAAAAALGSASAAIGLLKGSLALAAVAALGAAFAPVLAQCGLYWLVFSGMGILAAGLGQKRSKQICTLFGQGTRLCGAILVLYFFLVILSTLLLLLGGNGG